MSRVSQLLKVAHPEDAKVQTVSPGTSVLAAAKLMRDKEIGALPVIEEGKLVGMITERDMAFRILAEGVNPSNVFVSEHMTPDPVYVSPFSDVMDCLNLMKDKKIRHVPVLEGKKLVGIVSVRDVLYLLLREQITLSDNLTAYFLNPS